MGSKILIAEDEPNIVTSLEFVLKAAAYEVCVARDGEEALRLAGSCAPQLVLLDVMMPLKNGFEVCRALREDAALRDIKIVMLTARGSELERDKGLGLGADAYVTKPFSTKELLATVAQVLGHSEPGEARAG